MNDAITTDPSIEDAVAATRASFATRRTRPLAWRVHQLDRLADLLRENGERIEHALWTDLHKSPTQTQINETGAVIADIAHLKKNLRRWVKDARLPVPLGLRPARARLVTEPLGVVLIVAPWNYPVQLLMAPLAGALAAGNAVVLKPSELTPTVSALWAELVPRYLDPDAVRVVEGGVEETTTLLTHSFDYIFYTGNGTVGRIVAHAAADHLTPVTLELGGKSPVWFDDDENIAQVARRLAWAKYTNAGQTCVAPDYVLTTPDRVEALTAALGSAIRAMWSDDPAAVEDYGRIVNDRHFARLAGYLKDGDIIHGGVTDASRRYISPTVLQLQEPLDVRDLAGRPPIMREEIFGPILPVVPVADPADAVRYINAGDKPLALYVFSGDAATRELFVRETSSGGIGLDVPMLQAGLPDVPFGGVGPSGMGSYHGAASVYTFSHRKPVVRKRFVLDALRFIEPPFTEQKRQIARRTATAGSRRERSSRY
ncbi:MAG: aldehyde dehydrogenase family protein [Candidatus Microbacterium colombiense]|nr:MAG: aldehyde dehydrogenase family protein [Microbacterium sp.]